MFTTLKVRRILFYIFTTIVSLPVVTEATETGLHCTCPEGIKKKLTEIETKVDLNVKELKDWAKLYQFVLNLKREWKNEIDKTLKELMNGIDFQELRKSQKNNSLAIQNLTEDTKKLSGNALKVEDKLKLLEDDIKTERKNQSFLQAIQNLSEDTKKLEGNVLNQQAKLKLLEDDINNQRRNQSILQTIRNLSEDTKKLEGNVLNQQAKLKLLEDDINTQRKNQSFLQDDMKQAMNDAQAVVISSMEDMNKTIYEDHLQKIYYQLDEVAYKNETRILQRKVRDVETVNKEYTLKVSKLADGVTNLEENLTKIRNNLSPRMTGLENANSQLKNEMTHLNSTISKVTRSFKNLENKQRVMETSITNGTVDLSKRITTLESETFRKDDAMVLENKMTNMFDSTENIKRDLFDVKAKIQSLQQTQIENNTKEYECIGNPQCLENEKKKENIENTNSTDCEDLLNKGIKRNGVHWIWPRSSILSEPIAVYCDMDTDGGGWTVIQRRGDFGHRNDYFFRGWKSYKEGFGNLEEDFWIGNDIIHTITNQSQYSIRFDLGDFEGNKAYAVYDKFFIEDENNAFKLHVSDYRGNAGDSFSKHHQKRFSAKDRDNDLSKDSCAEKYKGAWWFGACFYTHLNGEYYRDKPSKRSEGIIWNRWKGYDTSLKTTEMKIRKYRLS